MKRKYSSLLNKTERHRVADAIYRMKREGFRIPSALDLSKIEHASNYNDIRQQVATMPGVNFQAILKNGRRSPAILPGEVAEHYIEASRKWNAERTKARKKGEELIKLPRYDIGGLGGGKKEYAGLTQKQANARAYKTAKEQIKRMEMYSPDTYMKFREGILRQNIYNSLNASIHKSVDLKKMIWSALSKMNYKKLAELLESDRETMTRLLESSADELLLPTGSVKIPLIQILIRLGIDVKQESKDSNIKGESIMDYIMRINLKGLEL